MILTYLIQKEFIQISRNALLPRLILLFPIAIMCIMPWVMNMEVKNIRVDVVDNAHSVLSQQMVHQIEASSYFVFNGQKATYSDALRDIEKSDADVVLTIPRHFGRDMDLQLQSHGFAIPTAQNPQILITANAADPTKGSMGASYLSQIVMQHGSRPSTLRSQFSTLYLYNKNQNYKVFMIPALMGILLMLFCGFLPTLNIVGEKEAGTIEQMNVTPVGKITFILSKLIPYFIIALFVMTVCFVLSWLIYGITCRGSLPLVYLISILLAMIFSGIGLTISNYSDTMQQAIFVIWFIVVCLMLLSGFFTPVRSMPDWVQYIVAVNPVHYYIDAIRTVFVRGGGMSAIWQEVVALAAFALIMDAWAIVSYKKNS